MLMPSAASASNMSAATPGLLFMPAPDERELGDPVVGLVVQAAPMSAHDARSTASTRGRSALGTRERQVGSAVVRDVLHDHVDVDALGGDRLEDRGGDARPVGHLVEGDLGLLDVEGDAADQRAARASEPVLLHHPRPGLVVGVGGAHVDADTVPPSVLHATGAGGPWRRRRPARASPRRRSGRSCALRGSSAGVGGEHAVDVGVDLAHLGAKGGGHGDGRGVRAPRPSVVMSYSVDRPWKPARIDDVAGVERLLDARRADVDDLGLAVLGVGDDAGLRAGVGGGAARRGRSRRSRAATSRCARRR